MIGSVIGVDGCPGGWLAVQYCPRSKELLWSVHRSFDELLSSHPGAVCIAIDIPIGLREDGQPRRCDLEARRVLAPKRASSVFPAPDRRWLGAKSYQTALTLARQHTGKGISKQAFGIYPKISEVDALMSPALQDRIVEVHPEVCFWALAGQHAMANAKRSLEGFEERRVLLSAEFQGVHVPSREETASLAPPACPDDVLDALAACWTAFRHATGASGRLPSSPQLDPKGLRMEMVY